MAFKKLTSLSLTDLFVMEIEKMILSGELKIGEKMPPERQLAEEMKVSLAVINAGIARLTDFGFLRVVPRKGVYVADYIRNGNMNTMKEVIEFTGVKPDDDVLEPIARFRLSIELSATKGACLKRTDEALRILQDIMSQIETGLSCDLAELAFQFHHEVAISSGNIYYPMIIQSYKPLYIMFYHMNSGMENRDPIIKGLKTILQAIQSQDTDLVEKGITESINRWMGTPGKSLEM